MQMIRKILHKAHRFLENQRLYYTLRKTELELRSETDRTDRMHQFDRLRAYAERGEYPLNDEQTGYVPCFIGAKDTRCAVGYLMERDGHADTVQAIARADNTVDLSVTSPPPVVKWGQEQGLSVDELAQIQPSYDHISPEPQPGLFGAAVDYIEPVMGIAKGLALLVMAYMAFRYTWWVQSKRSVITRIGLGTLVVIGLGATHIATAFLIGEPVAMLVQALTDTARYDSNQVFRTANAMIQAVLYLGIIIGLYPRYSDCLSGNGNDNDTTLAQ